MARMLSDNDRRGYVNVLVTQILKTAAKDLTADKIKELETTVDAAGELILDLLNNIARIAAASGE